MKVVINTDGEAISAKRASARGIEPDIVFIRDDGWTLGAPENLTAVAEATWPDQWVAVVVRPSGIPMPYFQWKTSR